MRWERLFADLDAQLAEDERAERYAEVPDRTRIEVGRITWADRVAGALGRPVAVHLPGVRVDGTVVGAGPDWLALAAGSAEWLVPSAAVTAVGGLPLGAAAGETTEAARRLAARLDLRRALRGVARDRSLVTAHLRDHPVVVGTVDRVAADHLDLAEVAAGEQRRAGAVRRVLSVPLPALLALRRQD